MNSYIFEKSSESAAVRCLWIEVNEEGFRSVANIMEMHFDGSKESLKRVVKCLYEMMFIGDQYDDLKYGYEVRVGHKEYEPSLEGKARKKSSKEINVITEQLWVETM